MPGILDPLTHADLGKIRVTGGRGHSTPLMWLMTLLLFPGCGIFIVETRTFPQKPRTLGHLHSGPVGAKSVDQLV